MVKDIFLKRHLATKERGEVNLRINNPDHKNAEKERRKGKQA